MGILSPQFRSSNQNMTQTCTYMKLINIIYYSNLTVVFSIPQKICHAQEFLLSHPVPENTCFKWIRLGSTQRYYKIYPNLGTCISCGNLSYVLLMTIYSCKKKQCFTRLGCDVFLCHICVVFEKIMTSEVTWEFRNRNIQGMSSNAKHPITPFRYLLNMSIWVHHHIFSPLIISNSANNIHNHLQKYVYRFI